MKSSRKMRRRFLRWLRGLGIMVPMLPAACMANGNGNGNVNEPTATPEQSVTLMWKSDGLAPDHGQISGTLADGRHYAGDYIEVMDGADENPYVFTWEGWQPYWSDWAWDGQVEVMDWPRFVATYRGTVIANLKSDDGESWLRCRFIIDTPATGIAGGTNGLCQSSDGETLDYVVLEPR